MKKKARPHKQSEKMEKRNKNHYYRNIMKENEGTEAETKVPSLSACLSGSRRVGGRSRLSFCLCAKVNKPLLSVSLPTLLCRTAGTRL